jgi:F420-dependent oxidoreductase-like protein
MKLAVNLNYRTAGEVATEAERLGFDLALAPEGYRSDAVSVLGLVIGRTTTIGVGSGVFQIPGRSAGMTALTAATLDALSGGRFRLGLGVSNPDISEGWYGMPFDRPLGRTREYVEVVRMALRGEQVRYAGDHLRLPPSGREGAALSVLTEPLRADLPVYLAAVGARNLELAGEIADGWLGVFTSPERVGECVAHIDAGHRRVGRDATAFEVIPGGPIAIGADPESCADQVRGYFAHFLGMGSKERNIYGALAESLGHGSAVAQVHERYADGDMRGAAGAVPFDFIDAVSLLGPVERVAERMAAFAKAGATTLAVSPFARTAEGQIAILRDAVAAFEASGAAS